jgi:hypothetical protein
MANDFDKISLKKFKIKDIVPNATILLLGRRRSGKCLGKGTDIMMYDGAIKKVEHVSVGDLVMGDDSTARRVLGTNSGIDTLYKITNQKGESYIVNSEHILSLKYTGKKNIRDSLTKQGYIVNWFDKASLTYTSKIFSYKNNIKSEVYIKAKTMLDGIIDDRTVDIPIKKYLSLSKKYRDNLHGYQVPIDFQDKDVEIDPYMIGYWLGDGNKNEAVITSQDSTILSYLAKNLPKYKCHLSYRKSNKYSYGINGEKIKGLKNNNNYFLNVLRKYNLTYNKHIPDNYKCNSRGNRLKLLAGILDADGNYNKGCFELSQSLEHEKLIDDIIFLARSLGFACYKHKKKTSWSHRGIKKTGFSWRIIISGRGIEDIPTLIPRKQARPRQLKKDVLVSSINIEELPENEYYGFELDGNHRFVLGNFIVTHNSWLVRDIFYHHRDVPAGLIFSGTEQANPFFGDFVPDSFIHSDYNPGLIESVLNKQGTRVRETRTLARKTIEGVKTKLSHLPRDSLVKISKDGLTSSNRFFIVLDDMLADASSWKKEKTIQEIFFNGRHFNLFFILTMQYPLGIPPALRSNIDYVFIFNEPSIKNRKNIYEGYAGMIPTFDHFCNILDSCTQNHECLVIKTSGNSTDLKDQVFWYKASEHEEFRVGHEKLWKYHNLNYNSRYNEERDFDQEKIDELTKKYKNTRKLKVIISREGDVVGYRQEDSE